MTPERYNDTKPTASRAREYLGFDDMETLREWRAERDEKNKKKELITLDNIIVLQ